MPIATPTLPKLENPLPVVNVPLKKPKLERALPPRKPNIAHGLEREVIADITNMQSRRFYTQIYYKGVILAEQRRGIHAKYIFYTPSLTLISTTFNRFLNEERIHFDCPVQRDHFIVYEFHASFQKVNGILDKMCSQFLP